MTVPKLQYITLPWTVTQEVEDRFLKCETGLELRVNTTLQCTVLAVYSEPNVFCCSLTEVKYTCWGHPSCQHAPSVQHHMYNININAIELYCMHVVLYRWGMLAAGVAPTCLL